MPVGTSHRWPAEGAAAVAEPPGLTAPVRNRYFYGKLLDVRHLEMEQRYLIEHRRRLNRLTVGFGVVCGLEVVVAEDGKGVVVAPGFAIDGLGREIVVTEPIRLDDPSRLSDPCGRPAGTAEEKAVTLCLAYRECETEPTPVLVSDCDVRETCAAGAVRERYALLVHDGAPKEPAYDLASLCQGLAERLAGIRPGGSAETEEVAAATVAASVRPFGPLTSGPGHGGGMPRRNRGCAPPDEVCVVLGVVELGSDAAKAAVYTAGFRRTIMSNDQLADAVVCLAAAVERCCAERDTRLALEVVAGDAQAGKPKESLPEPVVVRVTEDGSPKEGATVRFEDISETGGGFDPREAVSDAGGLVSAKWTLGSAEGTQTGRVFASDDVYVDVTATAKGS